MLRDAAFAVRAHIVDYDLMRGKLVIFKSRGRLHIELQLLLPCKRNGSQNSGGNIRHYFGKKCMRCEIDMIMNTLVT